MPHQNERLRQDVTELANKANVCEMLTVGQLLPAGHQQSLEIEISGKAITSAGPDLNHVVLGDVQTFLLKIENSYPKIAPVIQIETPFFHPNIAADGLIHLDEIGIRWPDETTLEIVVDQIWDVLRGANFDSSNALQVGAGQWYAKKLQANPKFFPVDSRTLTNSEPRQQNIVQYRRKGESYRQYRPAKPLIIDGVESQAGPHPGDDSSIHFIE